MVYPFIPLQVELQDIESLFNVELNLTIDVKEIWCPIDFSISYSNWITKITKHLLETLQGICKSLLPIAENKVQNIINIIYFMLKYKLK